MTAGPTIELTHDAAGRVTIRDTRTGKVWSGDSTRLAVRYFDRKLSRTRTMAMPFSPDQRVDRISTTRRRTVFAYSAPRVGLRFHVRYTLRGDDAVEVSIPFASIEERNGRYRLLSITPLPRWGAVGAGAEGYLFLPNRCGALCPFTTEHRATQRALIHGRGTNSQPSAVGMPVFGTVHGTSAFLGLVTSGEFDTQHVAETHRGPRHLFTNYVSFMYRHHPTDVVDPINRAVRNVFLAGNEATYVGMAKVYRAYVLNEKKIPSMRERAKHSPGLRYYYGAYNDIRLHLAIKHCGHPGQKHDGHGKLEIVQTFREAMAAVKAVKDAGIDRATFILVGCTAEGADGLYPTKLPPEERLGGEKDLRTLVRYTKSLGFQIVNWDNYTDAYQISPDWNPDDIQKSRDGSLVTPHWYWHGGLAYKICPEVGLKQARRMLPRMKQLGFEGTYLCDAMPVGLYNCADAKHRHLPVRRCVAEGYQRIASLVQQTFGSCHCENFQDHMAGSVDAISHVPMRRSDLRSVPPAQRAFHACFLSRLVPFYPIVYHGIVQYHILPHWFHEDEFLNEIEFGAAPRNNPRMSADFAGYLPWLRETLPVMKRQYDVLCNELGHLHFEFIENHRQAMPGVSETTYSDGTRVWVNYLTHDVVCDGHTIPARSYHHEKPH